MPKDNPQLSDGYTPLANTLFESILRADLKLRQLKVVLAIIRETYGWHRKEAEISLSRFMQLTGIDRRNISRSVQELTEIGAILRRSGKKMSYGQPVYNYVLNKKYWCQFNDTASANLTPLASANLTPNKYKKIIKERDQVVDKSVGRGEKSAAAKKTKGTKINKGFESLSDILADQTNLW